MPRVVPEGRPGVGPSKRVRSSDRTQSADGPTEESSSETSVFAAAHVARESRVCDPERFSAAAALKKPPDLRDVMTLCNLLESELPARGGHSDEEFSWSTGAYVHGGVHGSRQHVHQFPVTSAFLAKVFKELHPRLPFTTLVLTRDVKTSLHLDANNALGYDNGLVKVSPFRGGGLWVRTKEGTVPCPGDPSLLGCIVDFTHSVLTFDPHCKHLTLPWSQGPRVVLIGFVVKAPEAIPSKDADLLVRMGFNLPCQDTVTSLSQSGPSAGSFGLQPKPTYSVRASPRGAPLFIQLCAGSGLLSATLKNHAVESLAVDFHGNKARPYVHIVGLDLTLPASWEYLGTVLRTRHVVHVHASPPTGTTKPSRAQPVLRNSSHPWGTPQLDSASLGRLQSANRIFIQLAEFLECARELKVPFSVEHPQSSWLWKLPPFAALLKNLSSVSLFRKAAAGRPQSLQLAVSGRDLSSLAVADRSRAVDLKTFCEAFAASLSGQLVASGLGPSPLSSGFPRVSPATAPGLHEVRAGAQLQPKSSKLPPLVPEFAYTQRLTSPALPPLDDKRQLTMSWMGVPKHARLLRSSEVEAGSSAASQVQKAESSSADSQVQKAESSSDPSLLQSKAESSGDSALLQPLQMQKPQRQVQRPQSPTVQRTHELVFGVYREPVQFVYQALSLQHPFDAARSLPDSLARVLFNTLTKGPLSIMRSRLLLLKKWNDWAKELQSAEASLHASLHPSVRAVLQGKKLLLLDRIAKSLEWPDKHLHRDLCAGFKLSGVPDPTGVFEADHKPALASEEQFWDAAEVLKGQLWSRVRDQPPQEYDDALSEITTGETCVPGGKGWLDGPFSYSQLQERFSGQWMPCRRFAVWQNKWRPIDDLSESGLNATFGCHEKIPLRALDEVVWVCTRIMQAATSRGDVTMQLSSGHTLRGRLHDYWKDKEKIRPVTTTFDLKSAYKQLPLSPAEQCKAIVTIKHPGQSEPAGYVCHTLPFGACSSVLHFNRVSALLRRVMLEMDILSSLYYDDYPVVSPAYLGKSTEASFTSVMRLLGFKIADDKDKPFSVRSETLGVIVDTSDANLERVLVSNKPSRSQAISQAIEQILQERRAIPRELPSLFGRLQFAEAQILGRMGRLALHDLRNLERSPAAQVNLTTQHLEALMLLKDRIVCGAPRSVSATQASKPIVVFTDGCFEPGSDVSAGVGGVLFCPTSFESVQVRAFGAVVPSVLLDTWYAKGKRHLIGQVEMYAVLLARSCWADVLDGSRVIFFVDHSGVLAACISGSSKEDSWRKLLCALERADAHPALQWFSRVPSQLNISDGPSRGRWRELLLSFPECKVDDPTCPLTGVRLMRFSEP